MPGAVEPEQSRLNSRRGAGGYLKYRCVLPSLEVAKFSAKSTFEGSALGNAEWAASEARK